jgi:uncharacterized protein (TIGR00162 family)
MDNMEKKMRIEGAITRMIEMPKLHQPVLIEGLPGVGNVGKLAAEHLIDEIKAKKFAEIYSDSFPPQVFIRPDGTIRLVKNELYYCKGKKDLIILTGDYQGLTPVGQYHLVNTVLDLVEKFGTKMIYTLGGYGIGREIKNPRITGAATDIDLVNKLKKFGVVFKDEPSGGIVGASGLLLGMGKLRGIKGVCLMGETSGYMVDPNSAREVIKVLSQSLDIEINLSELETKAKEIDKISKKIRHIEETTEDKKPDDLRYIG